MMRAVFEGLTEEQKGEVVEIFIYERSLKRSRRVFEDAGREGC